MKHLLKALVDLGPDFITVLGLFVVVLPIGLGQLAYERWQKRPWRTKGWGP